MALSLKGEHILVTIVEVKKKAEKNPLQVFYLPLVSDPKLLSQ